MLRRVSTILLLPILLTGSLADAGQSRSARGRWNPQDRRGPYQEPAFARGYADGYMRGIDDRRDRDRYDPAGHRDYRSADQGYSRGYGSRDAYRNNYRGGFRQGYDEGYRGGGRGPGLYQPPGIR